MSAAQEKQSQPENSGYTDRLWIPRVWDGMMPAGWFRLLARNRLAISPRCLSMAALISVITLFNWAFALTQSVLFGRRIRRTKIQDDPIFVVGHWRSGTTLLHELLVLDPRFTFPSNYDCFAPTHFLVSGWLIRPTLGLLLPSRRPMDNMAFGWNHPQEDEFAMCNMGVPSPYLTTLFANRPPQYPEYLDLRNLPPAAVRRWKDSLRWFLTCLTVRRPRRIVLKSPVHTARLKVLLEMFPKAKFVHIVRDPYAIFPSTINLWKRLYRDEGLQTPTYQGLEEYVFNMLNRMYDAFEEDRRLLAPGQFCEVHYEEFVAHPVAQMRRIYEHLGLGGFEAVRPAIETYFAEQKHYKTNRYRMTPELHAEITRRWSRYIEQYGYASETADTKS